MAAASERWTVELEGDSDREFIMNGVREGFSIVDSDQLPPPVYCKNYGSTRANFIKVEQSIRAEIAAGNYEICDTKPRVISALGAIPKKDSEEIRLIHDLSRGGVNALASVTSVAYPSVEDAVAVLPVDAYIAKLDLRHAYRCVNIHPSCHALTGLQWLFAGSSVTTYLRDVRLPFGAAKSCHIFQRLTNAVVRMLRRRGFTCVGYLDDFLLIAKTQAECWAAYNCLTELLQGLGFQLNWQKAVPPCQSLVFLGIEVNTKSRTLALPASKLREVKELLASWVHRKRAKKIEIQRLLGQLNWCAKVIRGGRSFLRRLIDLLPKVDNPHWFVRLSGGARADINWWCVGLDRFNGRARFPVDKPLPSFAYATDATTSAAAGFYANDWFYADWGVDHPEVVGKHITFLELYAVFLSVKRWGKLWAGRHIVVRSDNQAAVAAVNKATSKSADLMLIIRELFWLSVQGDFRLTAQYIPGADNIMADRLSRLSEPRCALQALHLLNGGGTCYAHNHMSYAAFLSLQMAWTNLQCSYKKPGL